VRLSDRSRPPTPISPRLAVYSNMVIFVRNTIFAILMGLETDLRGFIRRAEIPSDSLFSPEEIKLARERFTSAQSSSPETATLEPTSDVLLDYLDLSQSLDVLLRHEELIATANLTTRSQIADIARQSRRLIGLRNRVCHARPLEPTDLAVTTEVVTALLTTTDLPWVDLKAVRQQLDRNPALVLGLTIPQFWKVGVSTVHNNLDVPEFDDTGFVGRLEDRRLLTRHLLGAHPVITVTGEGGLGKTALTMQCLFDIIERTDRFDAIVWTSLKVNRLTTQGVRTIVDAMTSEVDVLRAAVSALDKLTPELTIPELFEQLQQILSLFRVLVVVDNAETIDRDALRPLLSEIPRDSKVVLTSRAGIGELELRYDLRPMDGADAIQLFRRFAEFLNVTELKRRRNESIGDLCERLFYNPLAIRWFIQSYSEGRSARELLLTGGKNLGMVLEFCFGQLYDKLPDPHRRLFRILVAAPGPLSEVQLALLSDSGDIESTRIGLQYLHSSNLVRRMTDPTAAIPEGTLYGPSDFARRFAVTRDKEIPKERVRVTTAYRALVAERDRARAAMSRAPYARRVIDVRTTDQALVARFLADATQLAMTGHVEDALGRLEEARALQPDYFEVYRVSASIKEAAGDVFGATEDFEQALALAEGQSEPLLVHYSQFLRKQGHFEQALEVLRPSATKSDAHPQLVAEFGWLHALMGRPIEAAAVFAAISDRLYELGGSERTTLLTQHMEVLRRAAEAAQSRKLRDDALGFAIQALQAGVRACELGAIDATLIREVRRCFQEALAIVASHCDRAAWLRVADVANKVAKWFNPAMTDEPRGATLLELQCPEIASTSEYQSLVPAGTATTTNSGRLVGRVNEFIPGSDFTFVLGEDGNEYFLHRSQLRSQMPWEGWAGREGVILHFTPSPDPAGRRPKAINARPVG